MKIPLFGCLAALLFCFPAFAQGGDGTHKAALNTLQTAEEARDEFPQLLDAVRLGDLQIGHDAVVGANVDAKEFRNLDAALFPKAPNGFDSAEGIFGLRRWDTNSSTLVKHIFTKNKDANNSPLLGSFEYQIQLPYGYETKITEHWPVQVVANVGKGNVLKIAPAVLEDDEKFRAALSSSPLAPVIYGLVDADRTLAALRVTAALKQMPQLGLGLAQYLQDYDENLPPKAETMHEVLQPYLKDETLFRVPGDTQKQPGIIFNESIQGKNTRLLDQPDRAVAFFLSRDGANPDFSFGNKTVVGFMDGHFGEISVEESKNLQW